MTDLVNTVEDENVVDESVTESEGCTFTEPSLTEDGEKRRGEEKVGVKKDETNGDCREKKQTEEENEEDEERRKGHEMMRKEFSFSAIKTDGQVEEEAKPEQREMEAKEKEEWPRDGEAGTIVSNDDDSIENATVPETSYTPAVETPSQKKMGAEKEDKERREGQKEYEKEDGNEGDNMFASKVSEREGLGSPKETRKGEEHVAERQSAQEGDEQKKRTNVNESYIDEDDSICALVEALEALREDDVLGGVDEGKEESGSKDFGKNAPALDEGIGPSEEIPNIEDILSDLVEPTVEIDEMQGCLEKQKGGTEDGEKDMAEEGRGKKKKRGRRRRKDEGQNQETTNADNDDEGEEEADEQKPVFGNQTSQQTV
nr:unnamed protein product [Spirometra erinaceieuropaei]